MKCNGFSGFPPSNFYGRSRQRTAWRPRRSLSLTFRQMSLVSHWAFSLGSRGSGRSH
ncbi:hypothetical protein CKA32_004672 [Geitlerinema sp. FC II]|nr:hypothetical protein CKA32_004672 [Geitlerinema sp. FC II]